MRTELQRLKRDQETGKSVATPENRSRTRSGRWMAAAVVVGVALFLAASYYYLRRQQTTLTERETVVLAEFTNTTGDPVFDGTLRSEEHTSELQSHLNLVCRLLLEKKKKPSIP